MKPFQYCLPLLIIFTFIANFNCISQNTVHGTIDSYLQKYNDKYIPSKIYVSTDKYLYTNGERMWISAVDLDRHTNVIKNKGQELILELIGPEGNKLISTHILLQNGKGNGSILIPDINVFGKFILKASLGGNSMMVFNKEVFIRKNAIPPFLVDISFKEQYYGGGDNLKIIFAVTDYFRTALKGAEYTITLNSDEREIHYDEGRLDRDGVGMLSINLPNPLPQGNMVFTLSIRQKGLEEISVLEIPVKNKDIFINFYPEGGQLVHGLKNYMNIYAVDKHGESFPFEAEILNEKNEIVGIVKSREDGTASMPLLPDFNKRLKLAVKLPYEIEQLFELPDIKPVGVNLSLLDITKDSVFFRVRKSKNELPKASLLNVNQGKVYELAQIDLNESTNLSIAKNKLKPGINQLVLFNENNLPLAERMIFIAPEIKNLLVATTDKPEYNNREKVNLELVSKNQGFVALSVCDEFRMMKEANKQNILSSLYIDSELMNYFVADVREFETPAILEAKMNTNLLYLNSINNWHEIFSLNSKSTDFNENNNVIDFTPSISQLFHLGSDDGYTYFRNYNYENYYLASNPLLFEDLKKNIKEEKEDPYYKKMLQNGQSLRDVIFAMKQYQVMSGKIVFAGSMNSLKMQGGALIVLDNLKLGEDISTLDNINPYDVEEIFISTKPIDIAMHTGLNSVGIIEITTKKGAKPEAETAPDEIFEFVDHEVDSKEWKTMKDLRTTIHWEPSINLDKKPLGITYFQSDIRSIFIGTLEGIDEKGQPLFYRFEYESNNYPESAN